MTRPQFVLVFLCSCLFACKKINTLLPPCETVDLILRHDTSYLSTPLVIPTQLIEDKLNQAIGQQIMDDQDFENVNKKGKQDKLKLKITRLGNIKVHWKDNVARFQAPLLVLIQREIVSKNVLPLSKSLAVKTEFSLHLTFETKVNIGEDWQLQPSTKLVSYEWLSEVKAFGGLIDVKKMVERRLNRQMPQILFNMDATIQEKVRLERVLTRVWRKLQNPIRIHQNKSLVWLKIKPIRFEIGTITSEAGNLLIQGRLSATTETVLGEKPVFLLDSILPPLVKRPELPKNTYLYMLSILPYEDINEILTQQLKGKTFDITGHHIRIKSAEIWGCGENLVLHLGVRDAVRGDIYFEGKPFYAADAQQITIQNFDFELQTEETLANSADWLLHSTFKDEIKNALTLQLADHVSKIPDAIMKGIEAGKAGPKMEFTIEQWEFKPQEIWVRPTDLAALIIVNAQIRIELEKI